MFSILNQFIKWHIILFLMILLYSFYGNNSFKLDECKFSKHDNCIYNQVILKELVLKTSDKKRKIDWFFVFYNFNQNNLDNIYYFLCSLLIKAKIVNPKRKIERKERVVVPRAVLNVPKKAPASTRVNFSTGLPRRSWRRMTASKFPSNEPVRRVGRCCIEEPPGTWKAIMPPKQRGAGALCGSVFRTPTGHSFVPPVIGIGQCPFYPRRGASMWGCNIFYSFRTPSYPFVPAPTDRANPGAPYPRASTLAEPSHSYAWVRWVLIYYSQ